MSNPTPIGKRVHFNSNNDTPQATIAAKRAALSNGTTPRLQGIRTSFSTDQTLNSSTTSALSSSLSNNENNLITVAVRVRPLNNKETSHGYYDAIKVLNLNEILLNDIPGNKQHRFRCDHIITDQASANSKNACDDQQQYVYESIGKSMLDKAFDGYNASIFAYGQTGSGKTYSMIGTNDEPGLIPRFFDNLFKQKAERDEIVSSSHVEMSYYEIYNEKIYDLLRSTDKTKTPASITGRNLQIRENPQTGPYIVDLLTLSANSADDAKLWLNIGNKRRATASTAMNQKSSRSHSVFQLTLTQMVEHKDKNGLLQLVTSRINLVDLAGSERISNTLTSASPSQPRFKESTCINKSLLTLGKIICLLSERQSSNMGYLPYRESVLTWLLKESLGGNSKTTMLATVNASSLYIDETLCTLRYAAKTACIKNIAHLNCNFKQKIIDKFGQEMEINTIPKNFEMSLKLMEEEWKRKLEETAILKQKEIKELKDSLIVLYENETRAQNCCLINLNEDPSLSEKLIYLLKALNDEETLIGSDNDQVNIHLTGTLIAPIHAKITKRSDNYYIKQVDFNHVTYLNGEVINNHDELQLNHGDRIIFGGSHYFRFNNPLNKQQSANTINHFKDYQFARNEIEQKQNELTQRRLDEEMWKHKMDSDLKLNELKEIYEKKIESIKNDSEKEKTAYKMELEEVKNKSSKKIKQIVEQKLLIESQLSKLNSNQMEINNEVAKEERILRTPCASVSTRLRLYSEQKVNQSASIENQELILNHANSGGLFAITLRINEANKICAILGFEYEFKRYDFIDSQKSKLAQNLKQQLANSKCISVIDKRLGLITLWNLETFDDKLDMLRDTYNKYLEVDSQSASFVSSNVSVNDSQLITDTMDEWQTLDAYTKNGEQFSPRIVENAVGTSHTEKKSCKRRLSILTNSPSIVHNGNQSSSKHFGSMDCLSSNGDIDTDMVDNLPNESNNALIKRNCLNELSQQTPVNNTNNNNNNNNKSNFQRTPFISASISNLNKCKSTDLPKSAHTLSHLSSNHELDKQLKMCNAFVYATCRDALNENIQIEEDDDEDLEESMFMMSDQLLDDEENENDELLSNGLASHAQAKSASSLSQPTIDDHYLKLYTRFISNLEKLMEFTTANSENLETSESIDQMSNDQPLYSIKLLMSFAQLNRFRPDYWSLTRSDHVNKIKLIAVKIMKIFRIIKDSINFLLQSFENKLHSMTANKYDQIKANIMKCINLHAQYVFLSCFNLNLNSSYYAINLNDAQYLVEYAKGIEKQFQLFMNTKLSSIKYTLFEEFLQIIKHFWNDCIQLKLEENEPNLDVILECCNYSLQTHYRLTHAFKSMQYEQQIDSKPIKLKLNHEIVGIIYEVLTDSMRMIKFLNISASKREEWNEKILHAFKELKTDVKRNESILWTSCESESARTEKIEKVNKSVLDTCRLSIDLLNDN